MRLTTPLLKAVALLFMVPSCFATLSSQYQLDTNMLLEFKLPMIMDMLEKPLLSLQLLLVRIITFCNLSKLNTNIYFSHPCGFW